MRAALCATLLALASCAPSPEEMEQREYEADVADIEACGYAGCRGPHHPAEGLEFGALQMGAPVSRMPEGVSDPFGDCIGQPLANDGPVGLCSFVIDGVVHVVNGGAVRTKTIYLAPNMPAPPVGGLPFGLSGDETPDETLAIVRAATNVPMTLDTLSEGGAFVENQDVLRNTRGVPMMLYISFDDDGGMIALMLRDVSAPTD